MGFLTSLFGGFGGYAVAALLAAIFSGAGVGWIVHEIDQGSYQRLVASDAKAQVAAVETARDLQSKGDAVALAMGFGKPRHNSRLSPRPLQSPRRYPSMSQPRQTLLAAFLFLLSGCSEPQPKVIVQAPSVSPPANLMTPAQTYPLPRWPVGSRSMLAQPAPTPNN